MSRSALFELTISRTKEFLRQGEAVFWVFVFPILLALALGFAFREKAPDRVPIGVVSRPGSAQLATSLAASPVLQVRTYGLEEGSEALRTGKISLLVDGGGSELRYRYDPTRPDARIAKLETDDAIQRLRGRRDVIAAEEVKVTEPGSRYIDFLIPGLLGMNLMGTGMWGIGFSVATARMQKLLKRLVATPMKKGEYLLAQVLSRLIFLVFEVAALVLFSWWVFDVGVRGSLVTFSLICLIGAMTFSGIGLLVASRAESIEAVSGWMNVVMLPMWLLSGVFFSSARFPDAAQPFIKALPLTALNDALRAVMIEAAPLTAIMLEIGILIAWMIVTFLVALRAFKWN
jgi:ABC-2 type transport system permease protein